MVKNWLRELRFKTRCNLPCKLPTTDKGLHTSDFSFTFITQWLVINFCTAWFTTLQTCSSAGNSVGGQILVASSSHSQCNLWWRRSLQTPEVSILLKPALSIWYLSHWGIDFPEFFQVMQPHIIHTLRGLYKWYPVKRGIRNSGIME